MPLKPFLLILGAAVIAASVTIAVAWSVFGALPGAAFAVALPLTIALALAIPRR